MVVNALTIGSGGSAGREDPTAPISAGFALLLTRRLGLSDKNGRIAAALGISTIFTAPLDDGSMAVSIVYRDNCDHRQLIPGLITLGEPTQCMDRCWMLPFTGQLHQRRVSLRKSVTDEKVCGDKIWLRQQPLPVRLNYTRRC